MQIHNVHPRKSFQARIGTRHQRGMSLLEIIIVIVLIGAVLTVVGSRVLGGADRGKVGVAKTQINTLAMKVENFQLDTGRLPSTLEDLVTAPAGVSGWLGPYAKAAELTDPWGNPVQMRVPGSAGAFEVISLGKDGREGGESFDADIRNE